MTYTDCILVFSSAPDCDDLAQAWLDALFNGCYLVCR